MVGFFQNGVRQLVAGQRSGGNNRPSEVFAGKLADFFMSDADERMAFDLLRYQGCKTVPKTAVAVVEKVIKIVFIPKVMTLPIDCMMIDGIPTEYICLTI